MTVYHKEVLFSMLQREFTFPSSDGKTDLHAVDWVPDSPVRAVLQISHGVSEYILRYQALASFLTERGIAVAGHDHLGHGTSVSPGAPRLYFGPRGSWDLVEADLFARHQLVRQNFPDVPVFLMGHSMGSFLARTFLIRHPGAVEGAIIMGTGQPSSAVLAAGKILIDREAGCPLPPITGALPPTVRILTGSPATRKTWTAI